MAEIGIRYPGLYYIKQRHETNAKIAEYYCQDA